MTSEIFEKKEYPFEVDIWPIGIIIYQFILENYLLKKILQVRLRKKLEKLIIINEKITSIIWIEYLEIFFLFLLSFIRDLLTKLTKLHFKSDLKILLI